MESKQIFLIGIISALIGGLIGGGLTVYVVNPQVQEISNSLTGIENAISTQDEYVEVTSRAIDETGTKFESLKSELDIIKDTVTELSQEPKLHKIFQIRKERPQGLSALVTNEFEITGSHFKIDYDAYVENIDDVDRFKTWIKVLVYEGDNIVREWFLEGNDHFGQYESFYGTLSVDLPPGTYRLRIWESIQHDIHFYSFTVWDYY
jgi:hypothetical protein